MEVGVFDHLDWNDSPLDRFYRERLEIIQAYERAGFHSYHVASTISPRWGWRLRRACSSRP